MITTLVGNNIGVNLSNRLIDFSSDKSEESLERYISLQAPTTPNLQSGRSYFNRSWMISSSHLLKTRKGGEISAQVNYNNDHVSNNSMNTTTYFLETGNKIILEDKSFLTHESNVSGKLSYEVNKKSYFLNNTFSTNFSYNDSRLSTIGSFQNTQDVTTPKYSVKNSLKVIKRFKNNLITFNSRNEWNSMPEELTIARNDGNVRENIKQHSFYTDERVSLGFATKRALLSLEIGLSGYFRNLDTDLWGIDSQDISKENEMTTNYLRIFAMPKFEWSYKKLELTLNAPINLYNYLFSDGLSNRTEFFISPSLSARYRFTPRTSLTLRGSTYRSPASLHDIYSSILTDYRSIRFGTDDYYASSGQNLSISYNYRNASNGLFIMAMSGCGWNRTKYGTVQNIVGDYILYSYRSEPSSSRNSTSFLNISKTLDFMRSVVGIRGVFHDSHNAMLSQGIETSYRNISYSLSPFINGNISSLLNWDFKFTWNRSSLKISNLDGHKTNNFTYLGSMTFTPCPLMTLTVGGEFYHNQIEPKRYKEMFMLDTRLTFNINKKIELSASASNLLNKRNYSYTEYGTLSQYEHSYQLRGRELLISIYLAI